MTHQTQIFSPFQRKNSPKDNPWKHSMALPPLPTVCSLLSKNVSKSDLNESKSDLNESKSDLNESQCESVYFIEKTHLKSKKTSTEALNGITNTTNSLYTTFRK